MKKLFGTVFILILLFSLIACSSSNENNDQIDNEVLDKTDDEMFTDRDLNEEAETEETEREDPQDKLIVFSKEEISTQGSGISLDGNIVTVSEDGIYKLSGESSDARIVVNAPENAKIQLVLNGLTLESKEQAPIYIKACNKVFITVEEESTLVNGGTYTQIDENNIDGVIFSKEDLTINGKGILNIEANKGNGIVCKDDLVVTNLTMNINCENHGLDANNSVRIKDASIKINSQNDGIHSEHGEDESLGYIYISYGNIEISSMGDGFDASSTVQIVDGNIKISTTQNQNGNSNKGVKAEGTVQIEKGTISISSIDDSIHSNNTVNIFGGIITIETGDDGIHADETLVVNNGEINILKSYEGLEAHTININGGKITLKSSDDGINAAGGSDQSGTGGNFGGDNFQRPGTRPGGMGGMGGMGSSSSDGSITISGGEIYINASGDGIDANGTILIEGGYTVVCGPTQGDTAVLDYDVSGTITGGTFIGTGSYMMAQTLKGEGQGVYSVSVGNQQAGTKITLTDKNGQVMFDYTPALNFAIVILTSEQVIKGESYTIAVGNQSGTFEAQ